MTPVDPQTGPKLLAQVRRAVRLRHYSARTEESYVAWVRRYVRFHGLRHPAELGAENVHQFLGALADSGRLSASRQTQALSALLFLYRHVLHQDLSSRSAFPRAKQPTRLPVVLTKEEVRAVLGCLSGEARIVGLLMYGGGLRLWEVLQLRVKDLDFGIGEIVVRRAKGGKDRVTVLPEAAVPELRAHLDWRHRQHQRDLLQGGGRAPLPEAFGRKSPGAGKEWTWQYVFPATRRYQDPETGEWSRHSFARVSRAAGDAGGGARERHQQAGDLPQFAAFVRHPPAAGWLRYPHGPGAAHRDVATTMIYTHVLNRGGRGVRSPADRL